MELTRYGGKTRAASRTTLWRRKTGRLPGRPLPPPPDPEWAETNLLLLQQAAERGARIAQRFAVRRWSQREQDSDEFDELIAVALMRLVESSGWPQRTSVRWLIAVARNAVLSHWRQHIIGPAKRRAEGDLT